MFILKQLALSNLFPTCASPSVSSHFQKTSFSVCFSTLFLSQNKAIQTGKWTVIYRKAGSEREEAWTGVEMWNRGWELLLYMRRKTKVKLLRCYQKHVLRCVEKIRRNSACTTASSGVLCSCCGGGMIRFRCAGYVGLQMPSPAQCKAQKYIFLMGVGLKKENTLNLYNTLWIHESSAKFCSKAIIAVD